MISSLPTYSVFIQLSSEKEKNIYQKTRAIGSSEQKKKCFDSLQHAK